MPTKTKIAKIAARFAVGAGTSKIVAGIVQNNTDPKNIYEKIVIGAGSVVLGAMAADASKEYTERQIDDIVKAWNDMKAEMAAAKNPQKTETIEGEIIAPTAD